MQRVRFTQILCLPCAAPVQKEIIAGEEYVRCDRCGHLDTLEKAKDDCFVFTVAMAMSESALRCHGAHSCMYMPATDKGALAERKHMIDSGRIKIAAAA